MDLTTSKGTPLSKYSSMAPMRIPWPLKESKPNSDAARLIRLRNSLLVSARKPLGCLHEKRGWSFGDLFTEKWFESAACGS